MASRFLVLVISVSVLAYCWWTWDKLPDVTKHKAIVCSKLWEVSVREDKGAKEEEKGYLESKSSRDFVCDAANKIDIKMYALDENGGLAEMKDPFKSEKHDTCGIVTNSYALIGSGLGSHIDSNDFVIRFNHAPTKGYEIDVGSKTSLKLINAQSLAKETILFSHVKEFFQETKKILLHMETGIHNISEHEMMQITRCRKNNFLFINLLKISGTFTGQNQ